MEQRRVLLAIAVSLLIVALYQELIVHRFYPPAEQATPATEPGSPAAAPGSTEKPAAADAEAKPAVAPELAANARDVVVDTDLYRATFTTLGARLKGLELKRYRTTVAPDSPPLQLIQFPAADRLPLGLTLLGEGKSPTSDADVLYAADQSSVDLTAEGSATLTFKGQLPDGTTVQKRITAHGHDYLWSLDLEVGSVPVGYTQMSLGWDEGMNPAGPNAGEVVFDQVSVLQKNKLQLHPFAKFDGATPIEAKGDIDWMGFSGRYFLAAVVPQSDATNDLRVWMRRDQEHVQSVVIFPPAAFRAHADLYAGPKDIDRLETVGHGLRKAVDLGWFTFIALPMLQALRFLHRFTGNFGVAIIVLTMVIKLLFFPLTRKSFESMRAMQKLQPEMQKIRERLKEKPDEMNREVMELYKRHKVNPLGGCLPMVLQIPVFVGLYNALLNAVELRHAPFIGWITDLSAPDRLGSIQLPFVPHPGIPVLTVVMGVSMLVQQWMTPSAADPAQQRAMMIMPVVFTFMFINFPAGLTLYWLVNNLLTIGQQYAMSRPRS
ncbi:MAG TPA: membrane protein insertase YidC [Candidatus Dormibacteraeota bacterium]|nr:membrane protein insertase YidC [Candidatus Dormibacteraeota bacterium]